MDGKPVVRTAKLPDSDTELDMGGFYIECLRSGLTDLEIISRIRLYGVGHTSASGGAPYDRDEDAFDWVRHFSMKKTFPKLMKRSFANGRVQYGASFFGGIAYDKYCVEFEKCLRLFLRVQFEFLIVQT